MKLQADNINGVYRVEEFEGTAISQEEFVASLDSNKDSSILCASVDGEMAAKIEAEYGIFNY